MNNKLAVLCESQLNAVLREAEIAFNNIINSATTSLQLSNEIYGVEQAESRNFGREKELTQIRLNALGAEMQKIMIYLQFHDEFSQRINHVIELCRLQSERTGNDEMQEVDEQLLHRIKGIFSVSSEFTVLQSVFPEYHHESTDSEIDLF